MNKKALTSLLALSSLSSFSADIQSLQNRERDSFFSYAEVYDCSAVTTSFFGTVREYRASLDLDAKSLLVTYIKDGVAKRKSFDVQMDMTTSDNKVAIVTKIAGTSLSNISSVVMGVFNKRENKIEKLNLTLINGKYATIDLDCRD